MRRHGLPLVHSESAAEIVDSWIGRECVQNGRKVFERDRAVLHCLVEPSERLIPVAEAGVHRGDFERAAAYSSPVLR
jgi:hypothetical protein